MIYNPERPMRAQINALEIDDEISFPIEKLATINTMLYTLKKVTGKSFSYRTHGELITVRRKRPEERKEPACASIIVNNS